MADLYFNAASDNNASNLANWWQDDTFATPAVALPTTGDGAHLYASVFSGAITADYILVQNVLLQAGTYNGPVYLYGGAQIDSGTFNGPVDASYTYAYFNGGTFNGAVTLRGADADNKAFIFGGTFNDDLTFDVFAMLTPNSSFILNGRIRWVGPDDWYGPLTEPDYPAESDVRDGVEYADSDMTGTLGGGSITIEVS